MANWISRRADEARENGLRARQLAHLNLSGQRAKPDAGIGSRCNRGRIGNDWLTPQRTIGNHACERRRKTIKIGARPRHRANLRLIGAGQRVKPLNLGRARGGGKITHQRDSINPRTSAEGSSNRWQHSYCPLHKERRGKVDV